MPASESCYLGIDIGGSSIKAGIVTNDGRILQKRHASSALEDGLEAGLANLERISRELVVDAGITWDQVRAIGVAAPGTMDIPAGVVFHPFNLPGWKNLPLRDMVSQRFGKPAVLQNDANAAALGETWLGAGKNAGSLMFWTLGTGVGGGIVLDGKVWEGAHSHAAECGHIIIQEDGGPRSEFGIHGCVELYVGAKALVRRFREAIAAGRSSSLASDDASLTALAISQAAQSGDELSHDLILESAKYLAIGTVNVIHILNPEMVLVGGAMTFGQHTTELGRAFLEALRAEVKKRTFPITGERTVIDYASLGNEAGFIGAAACARIKYPV
ncbi:Glucokinase [Caulifigura coniformis]|uniref:Glucokinase n=1 Tax=Caulifigura coniformis TaxID=2527983 RepID=A0A517S969_9PLAN|nr:ROK family protein [Caulifigura coniformis]QDT52680.1 Glucokinase [Caulifigura coniformis]